MNIALIKLAQLGRHVFVCLQSRSDGDVPVRACSGGDGELLRRGASDITSERCARVVDQLRSFLGKLVAHAINLLVDGFHRQAFGVDARQVMLDERAKDSADENKQEQPHQHAGERTAKVKSAMQQDDRKTHEPKPEMAAHPRAGASNPPDRELLAQTKQSGEEHEGEAGDAVSEAESAAALDVFAQGVRDVGHDRDRQGDGAGDKPLAVRVINQHEALSLRRWLAEQAAKKFWWIHAMGRIVRAGVYATWFGMVVTQIARRCFRTRTRDLAARMRGIVEFDRERVQVDISVGTVVGAEAAANTPILDDDFERVATADGANGASDHAKRIAALATGSGDEVLIEAQAFANEASDAIMRVGAGAHALITASTAFEIEDEQALCFHQTLGEELVDGQRVNLHGAVTVGGDAFVGNRFERLTHVGEPLEHERKVFGADAHDFDVIERGAGRGARASGEKCDLAEVAATREVGEDEFAAGTLFGNFHEPDANEVEAVGGVTLAADDLPGRVANEFDAIAQVIDEVFGERREDRDAAEMRVEGAGPIVAFELSAERLVALQDVEHVAQHLEHDAVGFGANRGRARIVAHARHLAEEVAGIQLGDGIVVGQVNGSIDRDEGTRGFFTTLVVFPGSQDAFEAAEEAAARAGRLDMSDGAREVDLGFSFEDVEGGRSEIAFAADNLSGAVVAFDDGFLVQFEECARDVLKDRKVQKFGGVEDFSFAKFGADDALIGQCTGWARDHALAARDARRLAHGQVGVKGDAGLVSLAAAGKHPVMANVIAATNASVA